VLRAGGQERHQCGRPAAADLLAVLPVLPQQQVGWVVLCGWEGGLCEGGVSVDVKIMSDSNCLQRWVGGFVCLHR